MKKVTDETVLKKLNSGSMKQVEDKSLLKELNGEDGSEPLSQGNQEDPIIGFRDLLSRYLVKNPVAGLAQFGHEILNAPHNIANMFSEKLSEKIPKQEEFDYAEALGLPKEKNIGDTLSRAAPELMASLALPETKIPYLSKVLTQIPKAGKYIQSAFGNALSQGGFSAAMSPKDQLENGLTSASIAAPFSALATAAGGGNPLLRKIGRLGLGGGAGYLGYEGAKAAGVPETGADTIGLLAAILGSKGINLKGQIREKTLSGIKGTPYEKNLKSARELGLSHLTPAEASENPFMGHEQGGIGKTKEGGKLLYEKGQERLKSEEKSLNNLLKETYNPEKPDLHLEKENAFYEKSKPIRVPADELSNLKNNEVFKQAEQLVESNAAYRESLKNSPQNSIDYLDHVSRAMGDLAKTAPNAEAKIIKSTQKQLQGIMDLIAPDYAKARSLAERRINRGKVEEFFNKREMTGSNFAQFLKDKNKYKKLMHSLREVPNAQRQLENMKQIFPKLINTPTAKAAEAQSRMGMSKEREPIDKLIRSFNELSTGGRHDKLAVEMITNPHWDKELSELSKISNKEKLMAALSKMVGTMGAQTPRKMKEE